MRTEDWVQVALTLNYIPTPYCSFLLWSWGLNLRPSSWTTSLTPFKIFFILRQGLASLSFPGWTWTCHSPASVSQLRFCSLRLLCFWVKCQKICRENEKPWDTVDMTLPGPFFILTFQQPLFLWSLSTTHTLPVQEWSVVWGYLSPLETVNLYIPRVLKNVKVNKWMRHTEWMMIKTVNKY